MHPWIGVGREDRRRVLDELGVDSVDDLFRSVPEEVCVERLQIPPGCDEATVTEELGRMAMMSTTLGCQPSFLGAGVYRHVQPSVVDSVLSRAEFFTSYTPYQPEITQGTLQAIFEFQTAICQLTGCDIANASLYDGATSLVEAILMAHRVYRGKRSRVLVAETVHPLYRRSLGTYLDPLGIRVEVVPSGADGQVDVDALTELLGDDVCCVAVQSPSFLGIVEDLPALVERVHSCSAMAIHVVTEAVSLGLLRGGGEHGYDIVCGEAQSFGLPVSFGGPHLGFFACSEDHKRQLPGRLVGQTVDAQGQRAFCLTLSTREQHIRRGKATSNICTNHGLMALAATVWLQCLGGSGLVELARACHARAEDLKRRVREALPAWDVQFPSSPTFNELLVTGPGPGDEIAERLLQEGVLAGVPSRRWGGSWPDGLLMATTELTTDAEVEALIAAMGRVS
jgi:glycine dehydrogenase subunit 1